MDRRNFTQVVEQLVKNPVRMGKDRPGHCVDCGHVSWEERCRKCRKALKRKLLKQQAKINRGRGGK